MHTCSPQIILHCNNCSSVWCYQCACDSYFTTIITQDYVVTIREKRLVKYIRCVQCKQDFDLSAQKRLLWIQQEFLTTSESGTHFYWIKNSLWTVDIALFCQNLLVQTVNNPCVIHVLLKHTFVITPKKKI